MNSYRPYTIANKKSSHEISMALRTAECDAAAAAVLVKLLQ